MSAPRTFNGRSWDEAVDILRQARPPKKRDDQDHSYTGIEQFFIWMDKVFDGLYSYTVTDPVYMKLQNGQEAVSTRLKLDIFDDEGTLKVSYGGTGTCRLYFNSAGKSTNLDRAYTNASTAAFKEACKGLGIFGYRRYTDENEYRSDSGKGAARNDKQVPSAVTFHTEGAMYQVKSDSDGRPVWKVGGAIDGVPSELIFYASHYSKDAERFNRFLSECSKGRRSLRCKVSPCSNAMKGKAQYVFLDYAS